MGTAVNFTADTRDLINDVNAAARSIGGYNQALQDITAASLQYNRVGNVVGGTVKSQLNYFEELVSRVHFTRAGLTVLRQEVRSTTNDMTAFGSIVDRVQRSFQYFVAYKAFNSISEGLRDGISSAKELQVELSLIRTISQDSQQSFVKFGKDVRNTSDKSGIDVNQVGKAFYDVASNQVAKGASIGPFVQQAADFARVTGSELTDSVNLLSSSLNSYGLSAKDAEIESAKFFRTIDEGRVLAKDLANTYGRVGVVASNLGISQDDLRATVAITTQKGFKPADSLTLLTNIMTKLEKPTKETSEFFKSLGVDSGEAAIKLFGFTGVIRKMVEQVASGQVPVSAFFDEIRGRKQFGVFQQSIDEIEAFSKSLSNTTETLQRYNNAKIIRGESPADQLVKETNKLKNIFTVDLGQTVLKYTADIVTAVGGTDALKGSAVKLGDTIKTGAIILGTYATVTTAGTLATNLFSTSLTRAQVAGLGFVRMLGFAAVAYSTYVTAQRLVFGKPVDFGFNSENLEGIFNGVERVKAEIEAIKRAKEGKASDPFESLTAQQKTASDAFKEVLGLTAKANVANDRLLDSAKSRAKDAADAIKLTFGSFTNGLQDSLNKINKGITESRTEFESSAKAALNFKEQSDQAAFNFKSGFADGSQNGFGVFGPSNQKSELLQNRVAELIKKSDTLYAEDTKESIAEARKINGEVTQLLVQLAQEKAAIQKLDTQHALDTGVIPHSQFGPDVFTPNFDDFNKRKAANDKRVEEAEKKLRETRTIDIANKGDDAKRLEDRIALFKQAVKEFESLSPLTSTNALNKDFTTLGKFDQGKFTTELDKRQEKVLSAANPEERKSVEQQLFQYRVALIQQAAAIQNQEYLKTLQQQLGTENDAYNKRIENIKKEREVQIENQKGLAAGFSEQSNALTGFYQNLANTQNVNKDELTKLRELINTYNVTANQALENPLEKNGVKFLDPQRVSVATAAYTKAINELQRLASTAFKIPAEYKEEQESTGVPGFTRTVRKEIKPASTAAADISVDSKGRKLTTGEALEQMKLSADEALKSYNKLQSGFTEEQAQKDVFDLTLSKPIAQLKKDFPELAESVNTSFQNIAQSARDLSAGGLEDLRKKFQDIRDLSNQIGIPKAGGEKTSSIGSDEVYAATGGIVGLFPGQPRGADRYPIWAAEGERIIDAQTSRMFAPMLDAIMNRTAPRYMAAGGIIGDQSVGDVTNNITVNGGATNSETARVIVSQIERLYRRNQTRLPRG